MAYNNMNNMCIFEGRCTAGTFKEESINTQNGQMLKITFSVSVPRSGVSGNNNNGGQQQKTNDFITVVATGQKAEFIKNHFAPGHAIKLITVYREWTSQDQNGNKRYGHNFEVVDVAWTCTNVQNAASAGQWNTQNNQNGNNGGGYNNGGNNNGGYQGQNNNGYQNQPQQNNGGYQQPQQNPQNNQGDYNMFDSQDMPF